MTQLAYTYGWTFSWPIDENLRRAVYDFLQTNPTETKEVQTLRELLGNWKPPLLFKDLAIGDEFQRVGDQYNSKLMKTTPIHNLISFNAIHLKCNGLNRRGEMIHVDDLVRVIKM